MKEYSASIVGAAGITGRELLKILSRHRSIRIKDLFSRSCEGKDIADVHPVLRGSVSSKLLRPEPESIPEADVIFLALPHTKAMDYMPHVTARARLVVDLSADYRFSDAEIFKKWYGLEHSDPDSLSKAVYGLPEINRGEIRGASVIANPGCYATAAILSIYPLLKEGIIDKTVFIDAKSGISGAGKKLADELLFLNRNENLTPYNVNAHRHMGEVMDFLNLRARPGWDSFVFCPHLLPVERGILSNMYAPVSRRITRKELLQVYVDYYGNERFISLCGEGDYPQLSDVAHTNICRIGVQSGEEASAAITITAIDNLIKGASGQAVQNMNLALGLDEAEGLV